MFRRFLLTAAVAVAVALGAPATSQADFTLTITVGSDTAIVDLTNPGSDVNAGAFTVTPGTNPNSYTVETKVGQNFGGYGIQINSDSFATNGITAAVNDSTLEIANVTGTFNSITLSLTQTFSSAIPGAAILVDNSLGTDHLLGGTVTGQTLLTGATISGSPVASMSGPSGFNGDETTATGNISASATSLGITNQVVVSGLAQGSLGDPTRYDNFQLFSTVTGTAGPFITVTPAPPSLILGATMVPFFGLLRRRLRKLATETSVVA